MRRFLAVIRIAPLMICCVLLLCCVVGGCQLVGALVAKAKGAPPVPAEYVPKPVPTLVLAEHSPAAGVDDVTCEDIGRRTADFWNDQKLAPLINLSKLEELRQDPSADYYNMSTVAIGKAVGAKQVLYIDVRDSHDESAGETQTIRAKATVRVRIVDVETGQTLWPQDAAAGYSLDAETEYQERGEGVSESTQMEQVRAMIADKIVKLFYEHQPDNY